MALAKSKAEKFDFRTQQMRHVRSLKDFEDVVTMGLNPLKDMERVGAGPFMGTQMDRLMELNPNLVSFKKIIRNADPSKGPDLFERATNFAGLLLLPMSGGTSAIISGATKGALWAGRFKNSMSLRTFGAVAQGTAYASLVGNTAGLMNSMAKYMEGKSSRLAKRQTPEGGNCIDQDSTNEQEFKDCFFVAAFPAAQAITKFFRGRILLKAAKALAAARAERELAEVENRYQGLVSGTGAERREVVGAIADAESRGIPRDQIEKFLKAPQCKSN